ncbi:MAG: DNA polymerase III subunit delta [Acidimicrobiia bacterium]
MKPIVHIKGPFDAGPGEREEMLGRARQFLLESGADPADLVRVDVPGRGGGADGEGTMRAEVEMVVPALQSGSLFGSRQGVTVVDAHQLSAAEGSVLAELLAAIDRDRVTVALITTGALPAAVARVVREAGEVIEVRKRRERDATGWLGAELRSRGLQLDREAAAALVQRFGSDVAALGQALDQLASTQGTMTRQGVLDRFRNRPDEPMWHYTDAVKAGDTGAALRRLTDFLTHGHPLQLLAFLESDLRLRALASSAPDESTLAAWVGAKSGDRRVQRMWRERGSIPDSQLRLALSALLRADRVMKSAPEDLLRVTMERLTVALCRWYSGRRRQE